MCEAAQRQVGLMAAFRLRVLLDMTLLELDKELVRLTDDEIPRG